MENTRYGSARAEGSRTRAAGDAILRKTSAIPKPKNQSGASRRVKQMKADAMCPPRVWPMRTARTSTQNPARKRTNTAIAKVYRAVAFGGSCVMFLLMAHGVWEAEGGARNDDREIFGSSPIAFTCRSPCGER